MSLLNSTDDASTDDASTDLRYLGTPRESTLRDTKTSSIPYPAATAMPLNPDGSARSRRWHPKFSSKLMLLSTAMVFLMQYLQFANFQVAHQFWKHVSNFKYHNEDKSLAMLDPGNRTLPYGYDQSTMEKYFIENSEALGLNRAEVTPTCPLIFNTSSPIHNDLQNYFINLDHYNELMQQFNPIAYDLRTYIDPGEANIEEVCNVTKIHPLGLEGIFAENHASKSTTVGMMEPLLPVFRSHKICTDFGKYLMSMEYLVHDFYSMCKSLKRHSRTVFVDMGASLTFHGGLNSPAVYINNIYSRFGFKFDHIYAYEITESKPADVYARVPDELMDSFHWINVGVDPEPGAKLNPFTTLNKFHHDDFIVVKLDIDTSAIENRLARQLRDDLKLLELVDLFYFEDHRLQGELMGNWGGSAAGSIGESLKLMVDMRTRGVASHYWP